MEMTRVVVLRSGPRRLVRAWSPRQIWPPAVGLSSRMVKGWLSSRSLRAAAIPAGPAPMMMMGGRATAPLRTQRVPRLGRAVAGGRAVAVERGRAGALGSWQVRWLWASRHSKQIPMPQRGPRASPVTDWRIERLVMVREVPSGGVPFAGDFGGSAHDFVGDEASGGQRCGDAEAFVAGG